MNDLDGPWTAHVDGAFVVLLLGASPTDPIAARRVRRRLARLARVLEELEKDARTGLLGHHRHGGRRGVTVQYWRSAEHLDRAARTRGERHAEAWRPWFGTEPMPGFWHERFQVRAGDYAASYCDVPPIGLLKAGVPAPVSRGVSRS